MLGRERHARGLGLVWMLCSAAVISAALPSASKATTIAYGYEHRGSYGYYAIVRSGDANRELTID
jgi:hypothetical protein